MCGTNSIGATTPTMPAMSTSGVAGATGGGLTAAPQDLAGMLETLAAAITALQQSLTGASLVGTTTGGGAVQFPGYKPVQVTPAQDDDADSSDPVPPSVPDQGDVGGAAGQGAPAAPAPTQDPKDVAPGTAAPTISPATKAEMNISNFREQIAEQRKFIKSMEKSLDQSVTYMAKAKAQNKDLEQQIAKLERAGGKGAKIKQLRAVIKANEKNMAKVPADRAAGRAAIAQAEANIVKLQGWIKRDQALL